MFREVTLKIVFPQAEFRKLMSKYPKASSVRHLTNGSLFYLGDVQSAQKLSQDRLLATLEIRKDETPGWYAKEILLKALREEILIMSDSQTICRGGSILKIEGLDECLDDDIVEPLEAWIVPKKGKR